MVPGTRTGQSIRPICNVTKLKETAGYDEYGRWCGRTGAVRLPPTRFLRCPLDLYQSVEKRPRGVFQPRQARSKAPRGSRNNDLRRHFVLTSM